MHKMCLSVVLVSSVLLRWNSGGLWLIASAVKIFDIIFILYIPRIMSHEYLHEIVTTLMKVY